MTLQIPLTQIREIIDAKTQNIVDNYQGINVTGITTDSRRVAEGEIFLALAGENFDGHNFVKTAIEKGRRSLRMRLKSSI
ncbi:MAG: hypothetical protein HC847_25790, partial [Hydrococcus sp. RU_2_2]|nr:hypothetical protein [Hydrococcus sp. RU_2_2]